MDDPRSYPLYVERELRRIGVDLERLGALGADGLAPSEFLRWLRTIPGGVGHTAFMRLLQASEVNGGPYTLPPDAPEAPDVATYSDPELDEQLAFAMELDRVVPRESIRHEQPDPNSGWGFDMPHGRAHALAVLRSLPSGAGPRAFVTALSAALADYGQNPD